MMQSGFTEAMFFTLVPATVLASGSDYRENRVPNWLNASIALCGLLAQGVFAGPVGVYHGLMGMLLGGGALVLLWAARGMGAGDVKFMAAIGAWLGPQMTLQAIILGCLIGGAIALAIILARRRARTAWTNFGMLVMKMCRTETAFSDFGSARSFCGPGQALPYAVPLSMGTWVVLGGHYLGWWGGM